MKKNKTKFIGIRMAEKEYAILEKQAESAGIGLSTLVRMLLLKALSRSK